MSDENASVRVSRASFVLHAPGLSMRDGHAMRTHPFLVWLTPQASSLEPFI